MQFSSFSFLFPTCKSANYFLPDKLLIFGYQLTHDYYEKCLYFLFPFERNTKPQVKPLLRAVANKKSVNLSVTL